MRLSAHDDLKNAFLQPVELWPLGIAKYDATGTQIGEPVHDRSGSGLKAAVSEVSLVTANASCPAKSRVRHE